MESGNWTEVAANLEIVVREISKYLEFFNLNGYTVKKYFKKLEEYQKESENMLMVAKTSGKQSKQILNVTILFFIFKTFLKAFIFKNFF